MRCVIEGFGSIGKRHAGLLEDLGQDVACVTRQAEIPYKKFSSAEEAIGKFDPELYIICTETARHHDSLNELKRLDYKGIALVEKPLANYERQCGEKPAFKTFVAYNMRFHPIVEAMREELVDEPTIAARLSVGQFLPDWRPDRDYTKTYSAIKQAGGGVLRDLSHELDLATFFFGKVLGVTANIGALSNLKIDVEDWVDSLLILERCPAVTIHLDYLDRNPHRHFVIVTNTKTISADLWHNTLTISGKREKFNVERNDSFRRQLKKLLAGDYCGLCSWEDGVETMRVMEAMEKASATKAWEFMA